uniref:Uncharacterized protein n=1 Tax=Rhizophora mucronata TaxID=61149 RepID=A0A2P2PE77_RHIMU
MSFEKKNKNPRGL